MWIAKKNCAIHSEANLFGRIHHLSEFLISNVTSGNSWQNFQKRASEHQKAVVVVNYRKHIGNTHSHACKEREGNRQGVKLRTKTVIPLFHSGQITLSEAWNSIVLSWKYLHDNFTQWVHLTRGNFRLRGMHSGQDKQNPKNNIFQLLSTFHGEVG